MRQLTVGIPDRLNSMEPIEIRTGQGNLTAAYVERYAINHLPASWDKEVEGFYVLLSHINPDNTFTAYVGKTDWSFSRRLRSHDQSKPFWRLAVLFKKNSMEGFNRNQTAYLEGELVKALKASPNVTITNEALTGDRTFSDWEKAEMEDVVLAALRVLFLRGYRNSHMGAITEVLENRPIRTVNPSVPYSAGNHAPGEQQAVHAPQRAETVNTTPGDAVAPLAPPTPLKTAPVPSYSPVNHNNLAASAPKTEKPGKITVTPSSRLEALRFIAKEIRNEHPEKAKSYQYWASNNNLAIILDKQPKTKRELASIHLANEWHIKMFLLKTEEIIGLFVDPTQPAAEKTKRWWQK